MLSFLVVKQRALSQHIAELEARMAALDGLAVAGSGGGRSKPVHQKKQQPRGSSAASAARRAQRTVSSASSHVASRSPTGADRKVPSGVNSARKRAKREFRAQLLATAAETVAAANRITNAAATVSGGKKRSTIAPAASRASATASVTGFVHSTNPIMAAVVVRAERTELIRDELAAFGWWEKGTRAYPFIGTPPPRADATAKYRAFELPRADQIHAVTTFVAAMHAAPSTTAPLSGGVMPDSKSPSAAADAAAPASATSWLVPPRLGLGLRDGSMWFVPDFKRPVTTASKQPIVLTLEKAGSDGTAPRIGELTDADIKWLPKSAFHTLLPKRADDAPNAPAPHPSPAAATVPLTALDSVLANACPGIHSFRYIELFAGIGGFRLALDSLGGECVFSSEVDKHAIAAYSANYHESPAGDIRFIRAAEDVPAHDILTAGFPCQPFSTIGQRKGFSDEKRERGQLFWHIIRILRHHKPRGVILENVPGLVTLEDGSALRIVCHAVSAEGYHVNWHVVDAALLVPQYRKRVYIVGIRSDLLPKANAPPPPAAAAAAAAASTGSSGGARITFPPFIPNLNRTLSEILEPPSAIPPTLVLSDAQWYKVRALPVFRERPHYKLASPHLVPGATFISSYRTGAVKHSQFIPHPPAADSAVVLEPDQSKLLSYGAASSMLPCPRWLTARESARMQGFPESFKLENAGGVGVRAAYNLVGNAVSPPAIAMIAGALLCAIDHRGDCDLCGVRAAFRLLFDAVPATSAVNSSTKPAPAPADALRTRAIQLPAAAFRSTAKAADLTVSVGSLEAALNSRALVRFTSLLGAAYVGLPHAVLSAIFQYAL